MGATAAVFVTLFSLIWIVSCMLNYLDSVRKFPLDIFRLLTGLEIGLVYVDAVVCGLLLTTGIVCFVKNILEGN
jgi:hypothetical protein